MINNRFTIKKILGEGRSKVFLCSDQENHHKDFAIKILPHNVDQDEIKTFRNEFFTLRKLNHPNIILAHEEGSVVKIKNTGEDINTGSRYITLDYFQGVELLNYEGLEDENTLRIILVQICSALYYLHQSNYVYYDLKPENILAGKIDGKLIIKIIDMGFAHHLLSSNEYLFRGTTEYIAPEILKKEPHNHQVDLYSLGMMLYRIVYGKFPFVSESTVEIYKEQIENEFKFSESNYSPQLIGVVRKLLAKNPIDRYENSLQILTDLNIELTSDIVKNFIPASVFSDRKEILSSISNSLADGNMRDVIVLSGVEGSGKTSIVYGLYSTFDRFILVSGSGRLSGIEFTHHFFKKIIFSEFVYPVIPSKTLELVDEILLTVDNTLVEKLKSVLNSIALETNFTIVIDDFYLLDELNMGIFKEILPIFLVNNINVILTERSENNVSTGIVNSAKEVSLAPFNDEDLNEFLDEAFATFFPKDELKELILKHADLLPGSIVNFVKDLILLNILTFTAEGPDLVSNEETSKLLESSQDEIFKLRLSFLSEEEINIVRFLSSFDNAPNLDVISEANNLSTKKTEQTIQTFREKNILHATGAAKEFAFTSESMKRYVYSTIPEKEDYHLKNARNISQKSPQFNLIELARQYELGKDYLSSYQVLVKELDNAEKLAAFTYLKEILSRLIEFPLPEETGLSLKYWLATTLYKMNDAKSAMILIDDLLSKKINLEQEKELKILKGSCLIELGELSDGKELLSSLASKITDELRKQRLLVEIAYAEFDLNKHEVSEKMCNDIIENENSGFEEKGKSYNLLGLVDIYKKNDLPNSLINFKKALEMYQKAKLLLHEAKVEVNIGNIYDMLGDSKNAEDYWSRSLETNNSIGNLDQEAKILMNFGILYYSRQEYEKAISQYERANNIFISLGNKHGYGLSLINLGEVHLAVSNYQNSLDNLNKAVDIFEHLLNYDEEGEAFFLLGKLFYIIGDYEGLKKITALYKDLFSKDISYDIHTRKYTMIELLSEINNFTQVQYQQYQDILNDFHKENDKLNYLGFKFIIVSHFIEGAKYKEAYSELNEQIFVNELGQNSYAKAEKEYFLGIISEHLNEDSLLPPREHYEKAYELIKDEYISEISWKILYKLTEVYYDWGNFKKANYYLTYALELIHYFGDNIKDETLREIFYNNEIRRICLDKMESIKKE